MCELAMPEGSASEAILALARTWQSVGFELDAGYQPVRVRPRREDADALAARQHATFVVRGVVPASRKEELGQLRGVVKVWGDAVMEPFVSRTPARRRAAPRAGRPNAPLPPWATVERGKTRRPGGVDCEASGKAVGDIADVVKDLGVDRIWSDGFRGDGIVIGMVDGGITAVGRPVKAREVPVIDRVVNGHPADWGTTAAVWGEHGNMTATDVLGIAPNAHLWDIRIAEPAAGGRAATFRAYVSNAITGYDAAIQHHAIDGTPHILSNSWGLYDRANDRDFAEDAGHPFTRKVEEAIAQGILVLFAAGNCGKSCPASRCGAGSRGPGASILGPNGHQRVMCVGAANRKRQRCGYSSQGPSVLPPKVNKPDFCSVSHFSGYFPRPSSTVGFDGGTSAATAVADGVVALLKQKRPTLTQDEAKAALIKTAQDIGAAGWDEDTGAGLIDARAAFDTL